MSDKVLPSDVETERFVLAGIIKEFQELPIVSEIVTPDDFILEKHKLIFQAMQELYAKGSGLDYLSLFNQLKSKGQEKSVDGLSYLVELDNNYPTIFRMGDYCKRIADLSLLRRSIVWARDFANRCMINKDTEALTQDAERLQTLVSQATTRSLPAMEPLEIQEAEGGINKFLSPYVIPGIPIPFGTIDRTLSGFRRSKLILLAARPGVGKTAFAWQCVEHAVFSAGKRVLFISLEMSARDILHRGLTGKAQVSAYKFRHGELNNQEWDSITETWESITAVGDRLLISDRDDTTVQSISSLIRSLIARGKAPDLVCLDYVQILKSIGRPENRTQEVSAISRGLLSICRQFDLPVLALSQMNRDAEKIGREPQLSDLKDASQLEQDAHQIIFLWADVDAQKESDPLRSVNWKISKNRDGMLNRGKFQFERMYSRFYEESEEKYEGAA